MSMTPREIVEELDKHIIGQHDAKRAVAIALRNRWRRAQIREPLRSEITPKNILMIGPTGVGKTEIARRLARLAQSPFIKVEASKFTEVGYVGRDVESMVRDLVELAVDMVREEQLKEVAAKAEHAAEERLLDLLLPPRPSAPDEAPARGREAQASTRERMREQLSRVLRRGNGRERDVGLRAARHFESPVARILEVRPHLILEPQRCQQHDAVFAPGLVEIDVLVPKEEGERPVPFGAPTVGTLEPQLQADAEQFVAAELDVRLARYVGDEGEVRWQVEQRVDVGQAQAERANAIARLENSP